MLPSKLIAELIGTFALTFIGGGAIIATTWTGAGDLLAIAVAHGIALSIAVSAAMNISGGHINPAVTAAMLVTGRIKPGDAVAYVISQCVGAIIAGVLLAMIFGAAGVGDAGLTGTAAIEKCNLGTPAFNAENMSAGTAILVEAALTFLLVFAVFGTAVDHRAPAIGGFGIGLAVTMDILVGGPVTGAAMNPARTIGTLVGGGGATSSLWSQHWVYWVGPILGGVVAALIYHHLILKPAPTSKTAA